MLLSFNEILILNTIEYYTMLYRMVAWYIYIISFSKKTKVVKNTSWYLSDCLKAVRKESREGCWIFAKLILLKNDCEKVKSKNQGKLL